MLLKRITDGDQGPKPPKAEQFFAEKKTSYFNAIGIRFARVLSYLKELHF